MLTASYVSLQLKQKIKTQQIPTFRCSKIIFTIWGGDPTLWPLLDGKNSLKQDKDN